jgi:hypothetical protein
VVVLLTLAFAAGCAGDTRGPERAVREAIAAARAQDALRFQAHVETSLISPEDGVILTAVLGNAVEVGDTKQVEDLASVRIGVRDPGLDTTLTLMLRLREERSRWKVIQVEDARRFARTLALARRSRLERANALLEGEIRRRVQVGAVQRTVRFRDVPRPDQLYRYADISLRVPVFNADTAVLTKATVEVLVTDSAGTEYRYLLRTPRPIAHEQTDTAALDTVLGVMTGYPTDYEHGAEAEAIGTWRLANARPLSAVLRAGIRLDSIRPYESWSDYLHRSSQPR